MKNSKKENILIVAAHPDDEVLGCGATIKKMTTSEHAVYVAILGEGVTSRDPKRNSNSGSHLTSLHNETRAACKLLGVKEVFFYNLPDNRFDTVALLDVVKIIEQLIEQLKPRTVFTHHSGDINIDHAVTNRAVLTATRTLPGQVVKNLYAFEISSSTEWSFQRFEPAFRPNHFVDVSDFLKDKIKALSLYKSELRPFPHPRSLESVSHIARRWGGVIGYQAAEAFELIRSIN